MNANVVTLVECKNALEQLRIDWYLKIDDTTPNYLEEVNQKITWALNTTSDKE